MTITFEQATWVAGTVAALAGWSWWLVAWVARRHAEVTAAIDKARAETTAGIAAIQQTQKHQHEMNEIKLEHLDRRMSHFETVIDGITKVVVFPEGKRT